MNEKELAAGLAPTPGYRYAEVVGRELFVAGQVPHDAQGRLVSVGDAFGQAVQCLQNLATIIDCHGFKREHIRRLTIYVVGPQENLAQAWDAVSSHWQASVPPATLLGVARLGYPEQLVEIDAMIVKSEPA